MNPKFIFDEIGDIEEIKKEGYSIIKLPGLTPSEIEIINPSVPPTSGLRMEIFEVDSDNNIFRMTKRRLFYFLRVMKGIAVIARRELEKDGITEPSILLVSDDRPSGDILLKYATRIFAYEGYRIFYQKGEGEKVEGSSYIRGLSKMGTPYAAASVELFPEINVVLMLTASHNPLEWNGLKFYIKRPIPISGDIMKNVSQHAISIKEIELADEPTVEEIDADAKNNEYILELVSKIVDLSILKGKRIVVWPMLGAAPEIISLLKNGCGAEVTIIDIDKNPPDPTKPFDRNMVISKMKEVDTDIAILLDADRDRLVFIIRYGDEYFELTPNELYTAMHRILSVKKGKTIVNVRTIPSDPGADKYAALNFVTGVGYKHLGVLQYLAAGRNVPEGQLKAAILYAFVEEGKYIKLHNEKEIKKIIADSGLKGELIFVLWEESGGHTFNILKSSEENGFNLIPILPLIGDKYPAPAILVLCTLIAEGFNLVEYSSHERKGTVGSLRADNGQKLKYMEYFGKHVGGDLEIAGVHYKVGAFSTVEGKVTTIHLKNGNTDVYIRPSGTGPAIKVYVYAPPDRYKKVLENILNYIAQL